MSRHLYDIYTINDSKFGESALKAEKLFRAICTHRKVFTPVRGVDYDALQLDDLSIVPMGDLQNLYKDDYQDMKVNMIYGESPEFEELIEKIKALH